MNFLNENKNKPKNNTDIHIQIIDTPSTINQNQQDDHLDYYDSYSDHISIENELFLPSSLPSFTTTLSSSSDLVTIPNTLHPKKKHKPSSSLNSTTKEETKKINSKLAEIIQTKINELAVSKPTSRYLFNLRKVKKSILQCSTPILSKSQLISEIKGIGPFTAKLFDSYFEEQKKKTEEEKKQKEKSMALLTINSNSSILKDLSTNVPSFQTETNEENEMRVWIDEQPLLPDLDLPLSTFLSSSSSSFSSHSSLNTHSVNNTSSSSSSSRNTSQTLNTIESTSNTSSTSSSNFPPPHSPSYAILVSLFNFSKGLNSKDTLLSQSGLRSLAQTFTLSNLKDAGIWLNGIQSLIKHHLIKELRINHDRHLFYSLTDKGNQVASRLSISPPPPPTLSSSSSFTKKTKKVRTKSIAHPCPINNSQEKLNHANQLAKNNDSKHMFHFDSLYSKNQEQIKENTNVTNKDDDHSSDSDSDDLFEPSSMHGFTTTTTTSTTYERSPLLNSSQDHEPTTMSMDASILSLDKGEQSHVSKSTHPNALRQHPSSLSSLPSSSQPILLSSPFYLTKPKGTPVTLILDTREHIANDRTYFQSAFTSLQLPFFTRALPLGDINWVTYEDQVVNVIVERKRFDDLISSVQSSRFLEQIWRLKQSQAHIYYILETPPCYFPTQQDQSMISSCQAQLVYHGFHVITSPSVHFTVHFLHQLTLTLTSEEYSCEPNGEFYVRTQKKGHLPLQAIYTNMVQRIKGMSFSKTQWLVRQYPTLHDLYEALLSSKGMSIEELLQLPPFSDRQGLGQKKLGEGLILFLKKLFSDDVYDD